MHKRIWEVRGSNKTVRVRCACHDSARARANNFYGVRDIWAVVLISG